MDCLALQHTIKIHKKAQMSFNDTMSIVNNKNKTRSYILDATFAVDTFALANPFRFDEVCW